MHIEFLVEDSSGAKLIGILLPKILGNVRDDLTWKIHSYRGIGRLPKNLGAVDASKRILLDRLPSILRGYARTPGIDWVVVVADTDTRDCVAFLAELKGIVEAMHPKPSVLFRLAIEEIEAWYLGDQPAVIRAYPSADKGILKAYVQDAVCGTWETLANAIHKGGVASVKSIGWPMAGELKHEWAEKIGVEMSIEHNASPSFGKFRDGLRSISTAAAV